MEIKLRELKISGDDFWIKQYEGEAMIMHPNFLALTGALGPLMEWSKAIGQDWRERLFRLLWVYMFIKEEGQTRPIDVDKNFKIITGHKRAAAMLKLKYEKIKVNIIDYEKIGQK